MNKEFKGFLMFLFVLLISAIAFLIIDKPITAKAVNTVLNQGQYGIENDHTDFIRIVKDIDLSKLTYERIVVSGIKITAYNNEPKQTDSTPNTMSSNRIVYSGAVAVSSDLRNKYRIKFGDIIYIPATKEYYVFEDGMANGKKSSERIVEKTVDVFMFDKERAKNFRFLNQDIVIYRFPRNQ